MPICPEAGKYGRHVRATLQISMMIRHVTKGSIVYHGWFEANALQTTSGGKMKQDRM